MNKALLQLADLGWPKVLAIGLFVTAFYFFAFRDDGSIITANLTSAKQELDTATKQLQVTKKAMENAQRFESEIKAAKLQFEQVTEFMPPRLSMADLTTLISDKASKAGVRLLSTSPHSSAGATAASTKPAFFDSIQVAFKVEGSFAQILTFLAQISRDSRILTFEETVLTTNTGTQADDPTLNFSGELVGYKYKKEVATPAAPGVPGAAPQAGGAK
jgi:Tfp pilus assembly protein PilO